MVHGSPDGPHILDLFLVVVVDVVVCLFVVFLFCFCFVGRGVVWWGGGGVLNKNVFSTSLNNSNP